MIYANSTCMNDAGMFIYDSGVSLTHGLARLLYLWGSNWLASVLHRRATFLFAAGTKSWPSISTFPLSFSWACGFPVGDYISPPLLQLSVAIWLSSGSWDGNGKLVCNSQVTPLKSCLSSTFSGRGCKSQLSPIDEDYSLGEYGSNKLEETLIHRQRK